MRALIATAHGFEESELLVPYYRLQEEGLEVDVAALRRGAVLGKHGYRVRANLSLREAEPGRYELLIVPGGKAPQVLCAHAAALSLVKSFFDSGKPVAAIGEGRELLAAAGLRENVDGNLVTARGPADLPAFMRAALGLLRARASDAAELAAAAV